MSLLVTLVILYLAISIVWPYAAHPSRLHRRMRYLGRATLLVPAVILAACSAPPPAAPPTRAGEPIASHSVVQTDEPSIQPAAPQTELALPPEVVRERAVSLHAAVEQQRRLYAVAAPLLLKNADLCQKKAGHLLGLTAKNRFSFGDDFVDAAELALGLGNALQVMDVLPGSGAVQSGITAGDILVAVEGKRVPEGRRAEHRAVAMIAAAMNGRSSVRLSLQRDKEQLDVLVPLTRACAFVIELGHSLTVNSFADGYRVMLTQGMLGFARTDQEIAYVIAKEIAHNVLARGARPRMAARIDHIRLPGSASPSHLDAPSPYTPVLDATADKLSLYLLARAGYDVDGATVFWKRLATQYPAERKDDHTALHPATAYRLSVMQRITENIAYQRKLRRPLIP